MDIATPKLTMSDVHRAFLELPNEIALRIFHELEPNETVRLQRVCKTWQSMLKSPVDLRRKLARYDHFSDGMKLTCEIKGRDEQTVLTKKLEVIHRFSTGQPVSAFSIILAYPLVSTQALLRGDILVFGPDLANNIHILNLRSGGHITAPSPNRHPCGNGPNVTGIRIEDGVFSWHGVHYKTCRPTGTARKVATGIHQDTSRSSVEPSFHMEICISIHLPKGSWLRQLFGKIDDHWGGGEASVTGNSLFIAEVHERVLTLLSFDPDLKINAESFGFYETDYECIRYLFQEKEGPIAMLRAVILSDGIQADSGSMVHVISESIGM